MVLMVKFLTGLIVFCITTFNLYVSITAILIVCLCIAEFLKAVSWVPLLFIINDAVKVTSLSGLFCDTFLYADNTTLFSNNPS